MRIHDLSLPVSASLPTWPGDPPFRRELASSMRRGDPCDVSRIDCGVHTGTHVDAPAHFVPGAPGVDQLSLEVLIGPCLVVEASPGGSELGPEALPRDAGERVLFKTRNSRRWLEGDTAFDRDFVAVGESLARSLVERRVRLVGVDYLSVESFHAPRSHPVHHLLLEAGLVVVEGLDLSRVEAGRYQLYCLPTKLVGSDGAPARAILVEASE